jgi:hypothetical protein
MKTLPIRWVSFLILLLTVTNSRASAQPFICAENVEVLMPADHARVPITLTGAIDPFSLFVADLQFDPTYLTLHSIERGNLTDSFDAFAALLVSSDRVRITGFTDPPVPPGPDGTATLAWVVFTVDPLAEGQAMLVVSGSIYETLLPPCTRWITFVPPVSVESSSWAGIKAVYR